MPTIIITVINIIIITNIIVIIEILNINTALIVKNGRASAIQIQEKLQQLDKSSHYIEICFMNRAHTCS